MFQSSEKFKAAIQADSRMFDVRMTIGSGSAIMDIGAEVMTLLLATSAVSTDCVSIGGALSSSIQVTMKKPETEIDGQELTVAVGVLSEGTYLYCPIGKFTPEKTTNDDGLISFTAYDRMQTKLSKKYKGNISFPVDGKQALIHISDVTGVPLAESFTKLPAGVMIPQKFKTMEVDHKVGDTIYYKEVYIDPFDDCTYRDALNYIAQFYGKFAVIDRYGKIDFRWYDSVNYMVPPSKYYDDFKAESSEFKVGRIECKSETKTIVSGTSTPSIEIENPIMTQSRLDEIYTQIKDLTFIPASVSFLGDPRIDVGDVVMLQDKYGKIQYIPVMKMTMDYDGGLITEIQSCGKTETQTEASNNTSGPATQAIDRIQQELLEIKNALARKENAESCTAKTLSTTMITPSATGNWYYSSAVSSLANYDEIRVWLEIVDGQKGWVTLNRSNPVETVITLYLTASYNARVQLKWDTSNNKVGIYVRNIGSGWTVNQISIKRIVGVRMN